MASSGIARRFDVGGLLPGDRGSSRSRQIPHGVLRRSAGDAGPLVVNTVKIERAIEVFASVPNGGLVLPPNVTTTAHRDVIVALAARHHLPAVYNIRPFVTAGGLMSYGVDFTDVFRQAASVRGSRVKNDPFQTWARRGRSYFATSPRSSLLFQCAYTIVRSMTRRSSGR